MPLPPDLRCPRPGWNRACVRSGHQSIVCPEPDLIGGMRIKVGSDVYDGSVNAVQACRTGEKFRNHEWRADAEPDRR